MSFIAVGIGVAGLVASQYNANQQDTARNRAKGAVDKQIAERKDYQISPELMKAYNISLNNANGQSQVETSLDNVANRTLGQQLSNNSRYATSGSEAQLGATGAVQNYNQNLDQAAIAGSQQKQQNLQSLYGLSGEMANQEQTQYGYNQQYPIEQRLAFASALMGNQANQQIATNTANTNLIGSLGGAALNAYANKG